MILYLYPYFEYKSRVKALVSLHVCAGSTKHSLLHIAILVPKSQYDSHFRKTKLIVFDMIDDRGDDR